MGVHYQHLRLICGSVQLNFKVREQCRIFRDLISRKFGHISYLTAHRQVDVILPLACRVGGLGYPAAFAAVGGSRIRQRSSAVRRLGEKILHQTFLIGGRGHTSAALGKHKYIVLI